MRCHPKKIVHTDIFNTIVEVKIRSEFYLKFPPPKIRGCVSAYHKILTLSVTFLRLAYVTTT